jgi:hypothetical protein
VSYSYNAKLIPIKGYVEDRLAADRRSRLMKGFAFQIEGFEFCHTWLTRGVEGWNGDRWIVSHWESGRYIGSLQGFCTKKEAVAFARRYLNEHDPERVRRKIAPWINGESSPSATHGGPK